MNAFMNSCTGTQKSLKLQSFLYLLVLACPCWFMPPWGLLGPPKGGPWPGFHLHLGPGHGFGQLFWLWLWPRGALGHPPPWWRPEGQLWARAEGLLSLRLGFRFGWLGGRLSRRVSVRFGVRLLFGLGGLGSLLVLPMGHCCSMRGIQQMPLNPKYLLFPPTLSPPPLPQSRLQPPGR